MKTLSRASITALLLCLLIATPLYAQGIDIDLAKFLPLDRMQIKYLNETEVLRNVMKD